MRHLFTLLCLLACITAVADNEKETKPWRYVDAQELRVINKGWDNTLRKYTRLPAWLQDSVRPTLWERAQCSAGIAIRFATDSRRIGVQYQLLWNTHMVHMADTGLKGTDLYTWVPGQGWRHVNTTRPYVKDEKKKLVESTYVENLDGAMHEYMVYLPLYDGTEELFIKIDPEASITSGAPELIDSRRKIVAYGTSIMQGGCASRTGMSPTAIISRETNAEVVNIGISGEGKLDLPMARAMAGIPDVDIYLIDPVPNCTLGMCDTLTYDFVKIIRDARPQAKIVMVEGPMYPYAQFDSYFGKYLPEKNAAYRKAYEKLLAENPENLYYVTSEGLDGPEDDGTVDGIHLTDLGFRHYADKLTPILRSLLDTPVPNP